MIVISLYFSVLDKQISLGFGVPNNQISLIFDVPNNQFSGFNRQLSGTLKLSEIWFFGTHKFIQISINENLMVVKTWQYVN